MYLQGDLQMMFDALYKMGVIDPVLQKDWTRALEEMHHYAEELNSVFLTVNSRQINVDGLVSELEKFDEKALEYLAMEVAKEFADYHSRESLH